MPTGVLDLLAPSMMVAVKPTFITPISPPVVTTDPVPAPLPLPKLQPDASYTVPIPEEKLLPTDTVNTLITAEPEPIAVVKAIQPTVALPSFVFPETPRLTLPEEGAPIVPEPRPLIDTDPVSGNYTPRNEAIQTVETQDTTQAGTVWGGSRADGSTENEQDTSSQGQTEKERDATPWYKKWYVIAGGLGLLGLVAWKVKKTYFGEITMVIKGTRVDEAERAAAKRGLLIDVKSVDKDEKELYATTDSKNYMKVAKWFAEDTKRKAPYPAGSVLYFRDLGYEGFLADECPCHWR